jgi:hypothetical protein
MSRTTVKISKGETFTDEDIAYNLEYLPNKAKYFGDDTPFGAKFKECILIDMDLLDDDNKFLNQAVRWCANKEYGKIMDRIQRYGFDLSKPFIEVVKGSDGKYIVLEGRTRTKILRELGLKNVPVYVYDDMTKVDQVKYASFRNNDRTPASLPSTNDRTTTVSSLINEGAFIGLSDPNAIYNELDMIFAGECGKEELSKLTNMVTTNMGLVRPPRHYTKDTLAESFNDIELDDPNVFLSKMTKINPSKELLNAIKRANRMKTQIKFVLYGEKYKHINPTHEYSTRGWQWIKAMRDILSFYGPLSEYIEREGDPMKSDAVYFVPALEDGSHDLDKMIPISEFIRMYPTPVKPKAWKA